MDSDATPSPWHSLKRFTLRSLLALLILAALWTLWYACAAHALNSRLNAYRARGEPASPEDLVPPNLPPDQDGFHLAILASQSLTLTPAQHDFFIDASSGIAPALPFSDGELLSGREMIDANAAVLDQLQKARLAKSAALPLTITRPFATTLTFSDLSSTRRLARLLRGVAQIEHQSHHESLAIQAIEQSLALSSIIDHGHFNIHHLVAIACDALATSVILEIAPDLELQSKAHPGGIPRDQILTLIAQLQDPTTLHEGLRRAFCGERVYNASIPGDFTLAAGPLNPSLMHATSRSLDAWDLTLDALGPNVPLYPEVNRRLLTSGWTAYSNLQPFSELFENNNTRVIILHYRALVSRQAAALRLAIRLYEIDHGSLPDNLQVLTPTYLPKPTVDFFRADGGNFVYVPADRFFYSVNENGVDDHGSVFTGGLARTSVIYTWNAVDVGFFLDLPPH